MFELLPRREELGRPMHYVRDARLARRLEREQYTGLGGRRSRALLQLSRTIERESVPGDCIDCGVWNGGSTILMSRGAPSRTVWAFDSFEGLPAPTERDDPSAHGLVGQAVGSEAQLRAGFQRYASPARLRVAKGWFEDSFIRHAPEIDRVAILHIDADWYDSVRLALDTFYPKLSPGGFCAVDDYGYWSGCRRAVDEFRAEHDIDSPIVAGYYWRKPLAATE